MYKCLVYSEFLVIMNYFLKNQNCNKNKWKKIKKNKKIRIGIWTHVCRIPKPMNFPPCWVSTVTTLAAPQPGHSTKSISCVLIKSLRLGSPELSITIGRLATGILPPWPSLAGEHSWAPTGGLKVSGASAGSHGRTKKGQAGRGWTTGQKHPPPLPEGGLPWPAVHILSFLQGAGVLGHLRDLDAMRVRLLFVWIYAHNHSSCVFQLCVFLCQELFQTRFGQTRDYKSSFESDWMLTCYRLIKNWNVTLSQS